VDSPTQKPARKMYFAALDYPEPRFTQVTRDKEIRRRARLLDEAATAAERLVRALRAIRDYDGVGHSLDAVTHIGRCQDELTAAVDRIERDISVAVDRFTSQPISGGAVQVASTIPVLQVGGDSSLKATPASSLSVDGSVTIDGLRPGMGILDKPAPVKRNLTQAEIVDSIMRHSRDNARRRHLGRGLRDR
jgi:hypothetical protein